MAAYIAHYLVMVGIYTILALSLNLLIGYSGIFSLAHAAIYGIGAYASALVALKLGLGFWGGLVVAGGGGCVRLGAGGDSIAARGGRLLHRRLVRAADGDPHGVHQLDLADQRPCRPSRHSAARASSAT